MFDRPVIFLASVVFLSSGLICCALAHDLQHAGTGEHRSTSIKLNDMIDMNYMKRSEILDLRKKYVTEYPELVKGRYNPSEEVFGQIRDGKPWWGMLGISYYGPGQNSIAGPSKDSLYILNPFLLVGISEYGAHIVEDASLEPITICPRIVSLEWEGHTKATATYKVGDFFALQDRYHYEDAGQNRFALIAYNARDFGFRYLYIDRNESRNVAPNDKNEPVQINQFIHCGGSCGYPGGCNNMSPDQPDLRAQIPSLPAALYIKLWKKKPVNTGAKADMVFIIEIYR